MVCCLFFNFAASFDFGCSLAQEMNFVDCYLAYFKQQLITWVLSALLPFQNLFPESFLEGSSLPFPLFWCTYSTLPPLLCVSFQFLVYSVFCFSFLWGMGSVCSGAYAGLSQGWLGEYHVMLGTHLLVCQMSPKQVWSWHLAVAVTLLFSECNVV
jgi:hypothetical protein